MAIEILYRGRRPTIWRYYYCEDCGTVWRDSSYNPSHNPVIMQCPICGIFCEDITHDEALTHVPSGQCLVDS